MTRTLFSVFSLVALAVSAPHHAAAQAAPQTQAQSQPPAPKQGIDVTTAKKMVVAAEAAATAANAHVAIAVVDIDGDLVYFERMDGASSMAVTTSQGKARAALMFGMPTKEVQDAVAAGKPISTTITAPASGAWELTPRQGGLPILKDGKVVAAIACGGSAPAMDEKFAQAGIDAISNSK
jgi:glc operon protein GlcG